MSGSPMLADRGAQTSNGEQCIKVQHVNVHDGGQAIVTGSMQTGAGI
jgi:hypothetical protein